MFSSFPSRSSAKSTQMTLSPRRGPFSPQPLLGIFDGCNIAKGLKRSGGEQSPMAECDAAMVVGKDQTESYCSRAAP